VPTQAADEAPIPVQVALNNKPNHRQSVAEAAAKVAQLALKSKRRSKNNLPKKKPRRPKRKRPEKLGKKPEKAAEVAAIDYAGCMIENIEDRRPSRAGSFRLPALGILYR